MADTEERRTLGQRFVDWVRHNHEQQPTLGSEINSLAREAVKDVRNTLHETFFGQPEHYPEPGTPLNPTAAVITNDAENFHGYNQVYDEARDSRPDRDRSGMSR
jgi:hypothetical protein